MNSIFRTETTYGDVYSPEKLTNGVINSLTEDNFNEKSKTFIDNKCGEGDFLFEALLIKLKAGVRFEQAIATLYGADTNKDYVDSCRSKLLCGREDLRKIVEKNIICGDLSNKPDNNFDPFDTLFFVS